MKVVHTIPPVFDRFSEILILGSFPSVKSRAISFYYGNPRNRFWDVLTAVFSEDAHCCRPETEAEKREFLLLHRIALWDVVQCCEIEGSRDQSIRNVVPNDISLILKTSPIRQIYANGETAGRLYRRHMEPAAGRSAVILPSTSPANAVYPFARLCEAWQVIRRDDSAEL